VKTPVKSDKKRSFLCFWLNCTQPEGLPVFVLNVPISKKQMKLFDVWSQQYPETNWELKRKKIIQRVQGEV